MSAPACASCDNQQAQPALKCAPVVMSGNCYLQKWLLEAQAVQCSSYQIACWDVGQLENRLYPGLVC